MTTLQMLSSKQCDLFHPGDLKRQTDFCVGQTFGDFCGTGHKEMTREILQVFLWLHYITHHTEVWIVINFFLKR